MFANAVRFIAALKGFLYFQQRKTKIKIIGNRSQLKSNGEIVYKTFTFHKCCLNSAFIVFTKENKFWN